MTSIKRLTYVSLLACAVLAGCASAPPSRQALLTYETEPAGAQLFENNKPLGISPVTRTYTLPEGAVNLTTPDVPAVWPSGAKTVFFTILEPGADRVAKLERPAGAPGLAADVENGRIVAARQSQEKRDKERSLEDEARNSSRCQAQISGASAAIDNCR
jgi:hypothetical protein